MKDALIKFIRARFKHDNALNALDRWPATKMIKDPDPTSIASDMIEVPTHLGKYLKKTASSRTKTRNKFWKENVGEQDEETKSLLKRYEKILGPLEW